MPGADAVLKRNMSKTSRPRVNLGTRRITSATASTRLGGTGSLPGVGNVIANSNSQGRTKPQKRGL